MDFVLSWIHAHPTTFSVGAWYTASVAIGSMPMPGPESSCFYKWFFTFLNTLAANWSRAKVPHGGQTPQV